VATAFEQPADQEFAEAVDYVLKQPPRKQKIDQGSITWDAAAPTTVGDFQMIVFDTGKPVTAPPSPSQLFSELWSQRRSYLECWSNLDRLLLSRSDTNSPIVAFGGGQTAALLRAYAPRIWQRVETIILDEVGEAWNLDKPVASYEYAVQNLGEAQILIATSPRVQKAIAERLKSDGLRSIRWDDLVAM